MLRERLKRGDLVPFIGVYDVFSALLAAETHDALFISGFGFSASHYGLPDEGFIAWSDLLDFVGRVRAVLPSQHLLVDIDDGYCDTAVACHVARSLVDCPVVFNQIAGGKSPVCRLEELGGHGASLVIYSTPCLFAAQSAVRSALASLIAADGSLAAAVAKGETLAACNEVLNRNLNRIHS